jgi:hypothetical protein
MNSMEQKTPSFVKLISKNSISGVAHLAGAHQGRHKGPPGAPLLVGHLADQFKNVQFVNNIFLPTEVFLHWDFVLLLIKNIYLILKGSW